MKSNYITKNIVLDRVIEIVTISLRRRLKREPTEEEIVEKLPLFLCNNKEME